MNQAPVFFFFLLINVKSKKRKEEEGESIESDSKYLFQQIYYKKKNHSRFINKLLFYMTWKTCVCIRAMFVGLFRIKTFNKLYKSLTSLFFSNVFSFFFFCLHSRQGLFHCHSGLHCSKKQQNPREGIIMYFAFKSTRIYKSIYIVKTIK